MAFRAAAYQRRLEEAGFDPKMAHAQASAIEEFVVEEFLTRDHLDSRLTELRSEMKAEIASLEVRLIRWIVGSVGGATLAIILTLLRIVK